jgi:hypothetical protein
MMSRSFWATTKCREKIGAAVLLATYPMSLGHSEPSLFSGLLEDMKVVINTDEDCLNLFGEISKLSSRSLSELFDEQAIQCSLIVAGR